MRRSNQPPHGLLHVYPTFFGQSLGVSVQLVTQL